MSFLCICIYLCLALVACLLACLVLPCLHTSRASVETEHEFIRFASHSVRIRIACPCPCQLESIIHYSNSSFCSCDRSERIVGTIYITSRTMYLYGTIRTKRTLIARIACLRAYLSTIHIEVYTYIRTRRSWSWWTGGLEVSEFTVPVFPSVELRALSIFPRCRHKACRFVISLLTRRGG